MLDVASVPIGAHFIMGPSDISHSQLAHEKVTLAASPSDFSPNKKTCNYELASQVGLPTRKE